MLQLYGVKCLIHPTLRSTESAAQIPCATSEDNRCRKAGASAGREILTIRHLLVAPEYNAEVVLILFAFCNRACHIVVQPHDDLAEADLASCRIVPVIEIAVDVVGTPFHKLLLKDRGSGFHFLIGSRNLYLLGKYNHFSFLFLLSKPSSQNDFFNSF